MNNTLPKYNSKVGALQINKIRRNTNGSAIIYPAELGYASFRVNVEFIRQYNPRIGGYYIIYSDDRESYLPAESFESNYVLI